MDAQRLRRVEDAPVSWQGILKRSWTAKSRKNAIKAFCGMCNGYDRDAITNCADLACPLYNFRPFQK